MMGILYYQHAFGCTRLSFEFTVVKLQDYENQPLAAACNANPFDIVIWTQLASLKTKGDFVQRLQAKLMATRALYERNLDAESRHKLYEFIDQVMVLPESLTLEYLRQIRQLEEEKKMAYVTSIERLCRKQGLEQGRAQGIFLGEIKAAQKLLQAGYALTDVVRLLELAPAVVTQLGLAERGEQVVLS